MMRTPTAGVLLIGIILMLTGCSWFAKAPMDVLYYAAEEGARQTSLFVLMRGVGGSHRSFEKEGLVDDVRIMNLPFDIAAPNAHFGYYSGRTLIPRLKEDVIDPARVKGKETIWLVGFSMGGLGSILYLREHPDDIEGVCMISPYLGGEDIIEEIRAAGGVKAWSPGEYDPDEDWERMLWHWIKDNVAGNQSKPIYLAYGEQDDYVESHILLSSVLPKEQVTSVPGSHDYKTFKTLWDSFLESNIYVSNSVETE